MPTIPHVWRVEELARGEKTVLSTGHAPLDAQLPGGGWPVGSLIEVLQQRPGQHDWQLVLPAVVQALGRQSGPVVLVGSPFEPFGPSLQAQGLAVNRLLRICTDSPSARLWAAEQALRCKEVAAVLAWLPRARSQELRRMQLDAHQHERLLFVFRDHAASREASPARLRLLVEGTESMDIRILKRQGPPHVDTLHLPAEPARLKALLQARPRRAGSPSPSPSPSLNGSHALDRAAALP